MADFEQAVDNEKVGGLGPGPMDSDLVPSAAKQSQDADVRALFEVAF